MPSVWYILSVYNKSDERRYELNREMWRIRREANSCGVDRLLDSIISS